MVLLALPPADHLLIERERGQFVLSRRRRMMANVRAERLRRSRQNPAPSCVSPALQLKREWSPWPEFGSNPGNPRKLSKVAAGRRSTDRRARQISPHGALAPHLKTHP